MAFALQSHYYFIGDVLKYVSSCSQAWDQVAYPLQLLERKTDTVLHANFITNTALLAQDRDALDLDTILDNAGRVASSWGWCSFYTSPCTDSAIPSNDRIENACIMLDLRVFQYN